VPVPQLSEEQTAWIIQQVAKYTEQQRQTYRGRAVPLDSDQRSATQPFFPASLLDSTRLLVLTGERVSNPPFYPELQRMGFDPAALPNFSFMAAITFVGTVVSHEAFTHRLLFHELVHVVQYEKLGLDGFAAKYLRSFLSGGSSFVALSLSRHTTRRARAGGCSQVCFLGGCPRSGRNQDLFRRDSEAEDRRAAGRSLSVARGA
jgi:hypothetical protein